jgi:hypothetical protein
VGRLRVAPRGDEPVDDLPEPLDRPVDVAPLPGDLDVGLVDLPAISHQVAAGSGNLGQQRREPHHPPVDADVVDLDASFGEQFLDVAVGQAKAQVPADRQDDDVRREPEAGEGGPRDWAARGRALMPTVLVFSRGRRRCNSPRWSSCPLPTSALARTPRPASACCTLTAPISPPGWTLARSGRWSPSAAPKRSRGPGATTRSACGRSRYPSRGHGRAGRRLHAGD